MAMPFLVLKLLARYLQEYNPKISGTYSSNFSQFFSNFSIAYKN